MGNNYNSNSSLMQILHKTAQVTPTTASFEWYPEVSRCITLHVSHAIISRDLQEECNFPQQLLIWNILARLAETHKKTRKLAFLWLKKNQSTFIFLLPNIHALLVLITNSSLYSSPNIPVPQGCYWKELFSSFLVHRATILLTALWLSS